MFAVAGAATTRWSAAASSGARLHDLDARERARRERAPGGDHAHPERERARRDRGSDAAQAHEAEGASVQTTQLRPRPVLRRLVEPHAGHVLLEREHGGQHELGDRHRARPPGAGHGAARVHLGREAVDAGPEVVHPAHAARCELGQCRRPVHGQQHLALDRRVDLAVGRHLDDVDVGHRVPDGRGDPAPELAEDPHPHAPSSGHSCSASAVACATGSSRPQPISGRSKYSTLRRPA